MQCGSKLDINPITYHRNIAYHSSMQAFSKQYILLSFHLHYNLIFETQNVSLYSQRILQTELHADCSCMQTMEKLRQELCT